MRLSGTARARRNAIWRQCLVGLALLALLTAAFWFGVQVGGFQSAAEIQSITGQLGESEQRIAAVEGLRARAEQQASDANLAAANRIAGLEAQLPTGELASMLDLLVEKRAGGVSSERLRFVLEQVGRQQDCRADLIKRKLAPRLPNGTDPMQTISFLDNRITLSADAQPAISSDGAPLARFDPRQPVDIRLLRIGGAIEKVEGVLPLGHSVVADGREYRFGFAPLAKSSLIEVTLQDCAYP